MLILTTAAFSKQELPFTHPFDRPVVLEFTMPTEFGFDRISWSRVEPILGLRSHKCWKVGTKYYRDEPLSEEVNGA